MSGAHLNPAESGIRAGGIRCGFSVGSNQHPGRETYLSCCSLLGFRAHPEGHFTFPAECEHQNPILGQQKWVCGTERTKPGARNIQTRRRGRFLSHPAMGFDTGHHYCSGKMVSKTSKVIRHHIFFCFS